MSDSTASATCVLCGSPLDDHDLDRGTCHDCRSPKGKIADLDIAICASGDNPERIKDWPVIQHWLRERFGRDRTDADLWDRCTKWLIAEGRLTPEEHLRLPLSYFQFLLEHGFPRLDQQPVKTKLAALLTCQSELEDWKQFNSESGTVDVGVSVRHPLYAAVSTLQPYYGGALPLPALAHWRAFLELALIHAELAKVEADRLLEWLRVEIESLRNDVTMPAANRNENAADKPSVPEALTKRKKSTQRGEGERKLASALTKHHRYADDGCLELTPIGSNELAGKANVVPSTANSFFNKYFGSGSPKKRNGYKNYKVACNDKHKLIFALKILNDELPRPGEILFGGEIPDEAENPEHRGDRRRKPKASELNRDNED